MKATLFLLFITMLLYTCEEPTEATPVPTPEIYPLVGAWGDPRISPLFDDNYGANLEVDADGSYNIQFVSGARTDAGPFYGFSSGSYQSHHDSILIFNSTEYAKLELNLMFQRVIDTLYFLVNDSSLTTYSVRMAGSSQYERVGLTLYWKRQ